MQSMNDAAYIAKVRRELDHVRHMVEVFKRTLADAEAEVEMWEEELSKLTRLQIVRRVGD